MGNCFSVSLSCDPVMNQVSQCFCVKESYIHNLEQNLIALETNMEVLKAHREDLLRKVEREENKGLTRLAQIQVWLTRVETIDRQVNDLCSVKTSELQRLCLCGFCSTSLKLSYHYGKHVFMTLVDVKNLKSNGDFEVVAEKAQTYEVVQMPINPYIVGQELLVETAWNRLIEDGVGVLGVYGMSGVGKTTLLMQINNKCLNEDFDVRIWVTVSRDLQIQRIQDEVAKKLGFDRGDWNHEDEEQKACEIDNVLQRKKFILFLDDIWEKVDLAKIGVPFPNRENGSKIIFTTPSQEVCGRMGVDFQMEVKCLEPEDALDLFRKIVGENTWGSHPDIPKLAELLAKKCHGLPITLNVIGESMSYRRTIQEWHYEVNVLTRNAAATSMMEDNILPLFKYGYDNLKGEHVKSCLLYCALYPEDYRIPKDKLIEYWICEGFIDDSEGIEKAENQGYEIISSLVRSSLLMEEDTLAVYMHDGIREMALWIASDYGRQKDNVVAFAGVGLYEIPKVENWNDARRISLMDNKIDHISGSFECLQLRTLFLQSNKIILGNISNEFFKSMPMLVVLDLSFNESLSGLPDGISELVSLKYLNMSWTALQCLPAGLLKIKSLIHLDLENTDRLSNIAGISALQKLKVLNLRNSGVAYVCNTMEELEVLEHLEILIIDINSDSELDQFFSSHKLTCCMLKLKISNCQLESSDIWRLASVGKVRDLNLSGCSISEIKIETTSSKSETISPLQNPKNACFLSLSRIYLYSCKGPKELTWLMFAPNLRMLLVKGGKQLKEIIKKEKAYESEEAGIVPFQKLQQLRLSNLPELKNIYCRPLPFPCLTSIFVHNCPKLRKFPLSSESGSTGEGLVIKCREREWLEGLEWEDEATKARFL